MGSVELPASCVLASAIHWLGPAYDTTPRFTSAPIVIHPIVGMIHVQVKDTEWLIPSTHALLLPSNIDYRLSAEESSTTHIVTLPKASTSPQAIVFAVPPLAHEMLKAATRWNEQRSELDSIANCFFDALTALIAEWATPCDAFRLPVASSPELAAAMDYARQHLHEEPSIDEAAKLAGISSRTLARRFREETGTTWRSFVHDVRMVKAMELLSEKSRSVSEAASAVGFHSMGAFTRAFADYTGERPRDYHRRVSHP